MTGWNEALLGHVITLKRGYDLPKRQREEGAVPIVSSSGPTGFHTSAKADPPGVVTGRYGTLGKVFYVDVPYWPLNTTLYVKDFKGSDERFVAYFLEGMGLERYDGAAAVPGLDRNVLHRIPVKWPPREIQERVALVVAAYDELIENNLRRIDVLEEMAQAVYREWFVNFRFPGNEDVAIVNSSAGPIPEGWGLVSLDTLAEASRGLSWSRGRETDGTAATPVLTIPNIGDYLSTDGATRLTDVSPKEWDRFSVREGDVLMIGSNGNPNRVGRTVRVPDGVGALFASFLIRIRRTSANTSSHLLHLQLRDERLRSQLLAAAVGATSLRNIRITGLRSADVLAPPSEIVQRFHVAVDPMYGLQDRLIRMNANLREIRDLLLPRLVSGEIDVSGLDIDTEWLAS